MERRRELNLAGAGRGPSDASVGARPVDDALDGEEFTVLVDDRRKSVLDLNQSARRGPDKIFDCRPAALEDRNAHRFVDSFPVGTCDEVSEGDAPFREKSMRVVAGDVAAFRAEEIHRPTAIVLSAIKEATEVSEETSQNGAAVSAFDEG